MTFSIRHILFVTSCFAVWLCCYRVFPSMALHLAGLFGLFVAMKLTGRWTWLRWLPVIAAANVMLVLAWSVPLPAWAPKPRREFIGLFLILVGLIEIVRFALEKTRKKYRLKDEAGFVIFDSVVYSVAGGFIAGWKMGWGIFIPSILVGITGPMALINAGIYLPILSFSFAILGLIIGLPVGFICDAFVSYDRRIQLQVERAELIRKRLAAS